MDANKSPSKFTPSDSGQPTPAPNKKTPALEQPSKLHIDSATTDPKHSNSRADDINSRDMDPLDSVSPLDSTQGNPQGLTVGPSLGGAGNQNANNGAGSQLNNGSGAASAAAQGVPQPKVHTAFIHKLYNMLEDSNIQHLITWSSVGDSFMVTPNSEFSRVLAQYFKHTNVSSFVRQLNMYGFHKVNDVFHTGPPDSTVWEFKHGNGNFKRGDLVGLREIKRRASRHALIQRDSFSSVKGMGNPSSGAGTPNEHGPDTDARMMGFEHTLYEINARLSRTEDSNHMLSRKCQKLQDGLNLCQQWTLNLSQKVSASLPPDSHLQRDIKSLQSEIERHIRILEEPQDVMMRESRPFIHIDSAPISPRGRPDDEPSSRRPSFVGGGEGYFRTPAPPNLPIPQPRRLGSMSTGPSSPTSLRPPNHTGFNSNNLSPNSYQQQTPPNHLLRRHTSADIRQHGWNPPGGSPFGNNGSGAPPPPHWPPSDRKGSLSHESPREVLATYEFRNQPSNPFASAHNTPPHENGPHSIAETTWSFQNAKYHPSVSGPSGGGPKESVPSSRRGSLATNSVHALLNPEAAMGEEDVDPLDNDRKRKRIV